MSTPENPITRERALELLISELCNQIDEVAALQKKGGSGGISREVLREMGTVLQEFDWGEQEEFFSILLESVPERAAPRVQSSGTYTEQRLFEKRRIIRELREKLIANAA